MNDHERTSRPERSAIVLSRRHNADISCRKAGREPIRSKHRGGERKITTAGVVLKPREAEQENDMERVDGAGRDTLPGETESNSLFHSTYSQVSAADGIMVSVQGQSQWLWPFKLNTGFQFFSAGNDSGQRTAAWAIGRRPGWTYLIMQKDLRWRYFMIWWGNKQKCRRVERAGYNSEAKSSITEKSAWGAVWAGVLWPI